MPLSEGSLTAHSQRRWRRDRSPAARSAGVSTGGMSDTERRSLESHTGRSGRLTTSAKISASSSLPSVSRSSSATTRPSSTARFSTRTSHASSCAFSMSRRTSSSTTLGDLLGVVALVAHVAAEEHLALALAELDGADALRHAELRSPSGGPGRSPSRCRSRRRWSGRGRRAPPRRGRRGRRRAGRGSRCGWWSTCRRSASPSCSRGRGRGEGSSPSSPGRCAAARPPPGRARPRGTR